MAWVAPVLAATAVFFGAAATMPPPRRIHRLAPDHPRSAAPVPAGVVATAERLVAALGSTVRAVARRPRRESLEVPWGVATISCSIGVVSPVAGVVVAALLTALPVVARRRRARRRAAAVRSALPDAVDLVRLGIDAGLTPGLTLAEAAPRLPAPLGPRLAQVVGEVASGRRLAAALAAAADDLGEPVRPLTAALATAERDGTALAPALERLAGEVRRDRRRRAEEQARRLPVKLLFPLVLCALPAFALLTLVPLVAGALSTLRL